MVLFDWPTKCRQARSLMNSVTLFRSGSRNTAFMGSDSGSIPDRNLGRWVGYNEHVELEMMVGVGMTPMQALVSATSTAARVMKIDGAGLLQTGKWADLVVLNANPLTDIKNTRQIDSVYIGGRKVNMAPVTVSSN